MHGVMVSRLSFNFVYGAGDVRSNDAFLYEILPIRFRDAE